MLRFTPSSLCLDSLIKEEFTSLWCCEERRDSSVIPLVEPVSLNVGALMGLRTARRAKIPGNLLTMCI